MAKHSTNTPDLTGTRAHTNCMLKALWLSGDEAGDANSPQARSMRTALRQAHPVARLGDKPGVEADRCGDGLREVSARLRDELLRSGLLSDIDVL